MGGWAGGWMGIKPGLRDCLCAGQTTEIKGNKAITKICVSNICLFLFEIGEYKIVFEFKI